MSLNQYIPSGKSSPIIYLLLIPFLLIVIPALVVIYSLLIWYIPFIYLNFFITLGLGVTIGFALSYLFRLGKVRNLKLAYILSLIAGILSVYLVWSTYSTLLLNANDEISAGIKTGRFQGLGLTKTVFNLQQFEVITLNPGIIKSIMSHLFDYGSWEIRGITIKRVILSIVWIIEALIIIGAAFLIGPSSTTQPFSEKLNKWFDKVTWPLGLKIPENYADFLIHLHDNPVETLMNLEPCSEFVDDSLRITAYQLEDETETFISLDRVIKETDDNGKEKENKDNILEYIKIEIVNFNRLFDKLNNE